MPMEAKYIQKGESIQATFAVDVAGGTLVQLPDGRAAYAPVDIAAGVQGAVTISGIVALSKTALICFLPGGRCYWSYANNLATYKKSNDRDFLAGIVLYDVAASDAVVYVVLNGLPRHTIDMKRDPFLTVPTGTQALGGFGEPKLRGGARSLELTATSEVQSVDLLSVARVNILSKPIIEGQFRVAANGSGVAVDFSIGAASGTSTTDADTVANHVLAHIDGSDLSIFFQSKDPGNTTAAVDSTKDATQGEAISDVQEVWIDCRVPASLKVYVNAIPVLTGSTFRLNGANAEIGLLAHLEKATGTTTARIIIDEMTLRTMD